MEDNYTTKSYNMKIPRELASFFEDYINKNPHLGYKKMSQYILHIIQEHAKKLTDFEEKIVSERKTVVLKQGTYTKEELEALLKSVE